MNIFINKNLLPVNKKENFVLFENEKELLRYLKNKNIEDKQEFWFFIKGKNVIFSSFFEYCYEG